MDSCQKRLMDSCQQGLMDSCQKEVMDSCQKGLMDSCQKEVMDSCQKGLEELEEHEELTRRPLVWRLWASIVLNPDRLEVDPLSRRGALEIRRRSLM